MVEAGELVHASSRPRAASVGLVPGGLLILFALLLAFLAIHKQQPPASVAASAPSTEFSSARAMKHLQVISQKPHPIGTAEHAVVRDYLMGQLTALGVNPEIQKATVISDRFRAPLPLHVGTVENILARLKGTNSSKALLLVAHYDSVPTSVGASDDGAAVAALLECLRALKAGAALKNDVIFLFTDGEETGLMGAQGFVEGHPWAKDVGLVLNFEARGNGGPSLMFETSAQNDWLIDQFTQAASSAVTNSLLYEAYKVLPNDSDLSIFKKAGLAGLNFAYIEGLPRFHTLADNLEVLDERSLQHHGAYALELTHHFGNLNFDSQISKSDSIYFNTFGTSLVHYSKNVAIAASIFATALFIAVAMFGFAKGHLTIPGIGLGLLALLLIMIFAGTIVTILWFMIVRVHRDYGSILQGFTYNGRLYLASFAAATIAIASGAYAFLARKAAMADLLFGGLIWWLILMLLTTLHAPGASYFFTWPLVFSLIGLGVSFALERPGKPSSVGAISLYLGSLPGIVLCCPLIYLIAMALPLNASAAFVALEVLMLCLLVPYLRLITAKHQWSLTAAAVIVSVIFLAAGTATSGFDRLHPKQNNIFYCLNADTGQSIWASADERLDEWTRQFFPGGARRGPIPEYAHIDQQFLNGPAALDQSIEGPNLTLLTDKVKDGVRRIELQVISPRQAPYVSIFVSANVDVLEATINGKQIDHSSIPQQRGLGLLYYAPPKEGIPLALEIRSSGPLTIGLTDQSYELPASLMKSLNARPDYMMPTPFPFNPYGDSTVVSRSFTF